jgi:hypothetical protein
MNTEDKLSQLEQLLSDVTEYINLRFDALKLRMVDHLSAFSGLLLSIIAGMLLLMLAFLFILSGLIYWLGQALHSPAGAMIITGGFTICLAVLVFMLRNHIFTNRMVRFFIKMFFNSSLSDSSREKSDDIKEENDEA